MKRQPTEQEGIDLGIMQQFFLQLLVVLGLRGRPMVAEGGNGDERDLAGVRHREFL